MELLVTPLPPCVIHEDSDLLVVNKPPGWNTHAPAPHAGEGIYEWFRHREPRWATLAIVHRLDKDTSGLLVFGKTPEANRSLTDQFARRKVHKEYVLVTDRRVERDSWTVRSAIARMGDRYGVRDASAGGDPAETHFRVFRRDADRTWIQAEPVTGRTHQIRVHASSEGMAILGDPLYGGSPAERLHLHAARLSLSHPRTGEPMVWEVQPAFDLSNRVALRAAVMGSDTTAYRCVHGASDGFAGVHAERLGDWLLIEGEGDAPPPAVVDNLTRDSSLAARGIYFKQLRRQVRQSVPAEVSPKSCHGEPAPARFEVLENGLRYELSFSEGYSTGLFLDQRDNRRRLITGHVGADFPLVADDSVPREVLNCFSYTCGFSVAAASGGLRTTSLDLSRKYLDWGRRHFALNGMESTAHDFIYGDVFDWLGRLAKKSRRFGVVILDPPTFSRSREHGDFRAESDYGDLVSLALPLLAPGGVLLASTNAARLPAAAFLECIRAAIHRGHRTPLKELYIPQPPDFPVTREEPAHLKTVWIRVS